MGNVSFLNLRKTSLQGEILHGRTFPRKQRGLGGFYERLVAPVKNCLKKTLGKSRLDFNELLTVLHEVELILNSKPLTHISDDINDDILTPNHVLFGRKLPLTNESDDPHDVDHTPDTAEELTTRMRYLQKLIDKFWNQWRNDYLLSLREQMRPHQNTVTSKPQIDDIVLVHDDKVPRHRWNVARIVAVETGSDGQIRSARVVSAKTGNIVRRPINKLYPILTSNDE